MYHNQLVLWYKILKAVYHAFDWVIMLSDHRKSRQLALLFFKYKDSQRNLLFCAWTLLQPIRYVTDCLYNSLKQWTHHSKPMGDNKLVTCRETLSTPAKEQF